MARRDFRSAVRKFQALARESAAILGHPLRIVGEEIMTDVRASRAGHGVPVDTGNLRSTGRVAGPTGSPPRVTLSFGGAAAPYALRQHEDLSLHHKIGEPRYLVRGVERWQIDGSAAVAALRENATQAIRRARSA